MFYVFGDDVQTKVYSDIEKGKLVCSFMSVSELEKVYEDLGFSESNVEACRDSNSFFRSTVEVYDNYTYAQLHLYDSMSDDTDDRLSLFIKKDLVIFVDISSSDHQAFNAFNRAIKRFASKNMTLERLLYSFIDEISSKDHEEIDIISTLMTKMESTVLEGVPSDDFNRQLLDLKKKLQRMHKHYSHYLDIIEVLDADENDIFSENDDDPLMYLSNIEKRIQRLKDDVDSLASEATHLQDAYSSYLDKDMNKTMKYLTVMGTIFLPLTIIVGWYGMNFVKMPELTWKYGYVYVILLSVFSVVTLMYIGKKKRWF